MVGSGINPPQCLEEQAMSASKAHMPSHAWTTIHIGEEWSSMFRSFARTAFRLETLQAYAEPSEAEAFALFLKGDPPPPLWMSEWCSMVKSHIAAGRTMRRVHVVNLPLGDYLDFEIRWGYLHTSEAGEDIRLIHRATLTPELERITREDFWLFDSSTVMINDYTPAGTLYQARITQVPELVLRYAEIERRVWEMSVPFKKFYQDATGEAL
jgi:hypothetical protein